MPSKSVSQQGFMGMVHAVQTGRMPISKASPRVRHVATSMQPKDVTEFAVTKHKGLPEHVADSKSAGYLAGVVLNLVKQSDVVATLNKVRHTVHQAGEQRRKTLHAEIKRLHGQNEKLKSDLQKSNATAAAGQNPQMLPAPPLAQAPYGDMLQQMQQPQDDKAKKPDAGLKPAGVTGVMPSPVKV